MTVWDDRLGVQIARNGATACIEERVHVDRETVGMLARAGERLEQHLPPF